jgi:hypothetical protein
MTKQRNQGNKARKRDLKEQFGSARQVRKALRGLRREGKLAYAEERKPTKVEAQAEEPHHKDLGHVERLWAAVALAGTYIAPPRRTKGQLL